MDEVEKLNGSEIFDSKFASIYNILYDILSVIYITFELLFLLIVIFKTPPFMKRLKLYLIFYLFLKLYSEKIMEV